MMPAHEARGARRPWKSYEHSIQQRRQSWRALVPVPTESESAARRFRNADITALHNEELRADSRAVLRALEELVIARANPIVWSTGTSVVTARGWLSVRAAESAREAQRRRALREIR